MEALNQLKKFLQRTVSILTMVLLALGLSSCQASAGQSEADTTDSGAALTIAVGIVPEASFIEAVAGDLATVVTLIPPGYSPANYQPTAQEMQALSDAVVYFTLQMPTEQANILPKVSDFNDDIEIVDLRAAVANVYPLLNTDGEEITSDESDSVDPHLWLSPKRAIVMVQTIADKLSAIDEPNADTYQANAADYIAKLEALDTQIRQTLSSVDNKTFLIYHAAYGYYAHDYGLNMVAIEIEGKQATAEEMQSVIDYAKQNGIKTVFYQEEFDSTQAETIAEEIGGAVQTVAPLSADYIQGLEDFTDAFAQFEE